MIRTFIREKYSDIPKDLFTDIEREKTTIFLYGRSNSGKSYTANEILFLLNTKVSNLKIVEIYNEKEKVLVDLLNANPQTIIEKYKKLEKKVKATELNDNSSRSHIIIKLKNLCIVDAMGSERPKDRDGILANQSLLHLGNVLRKMKENRKQTFRECKLTMVLKECLTRSNVIFIGCVDPKDKLETDRTVKFIKGIEGIKYDRENDSSDDEIEKGEWDDIFDKINELEELLDM